MLSTTVWPSGLRRWLQAPVRKGVGSNPTAVTLRCACSVIAGAELVRGPAKQRGCCRDSLAEWSKALAQGASPQGRGFEPHSCHLTTPPFVFFCAGAIRAMTRQYEQDCGTSTGTWCSGITPAQHAGGPGFNPQCVHISCFTYVD